MKFDDLSLRSKLFVAMGVIVASVIIVGVVTYHHLQNINNLADRIELYSDINSNVLTPADGKLNDILKSRDTTGLYRITNE